MPTTQLLDLDINKLFEEHTVKEIEQIQKKIQYESDRKKIELRTLVGERYRDLIQAADTIAEMKQTSENVISRIADIENTFRQLQQKYLIGFKVDTPEKTAYRDSQDVSDSVVMQIKILMDIPEHIWSAIDNRDYLLAAQLFILARRINYSLTFEVGQSALNTKYPIVSKQWNTVGHFKNIIFDECNNTLRSLDLSTEAAANCLSALVSMDGATSKDLLVKLMNFRSQAVESIVKDESPHSVRHRVRLSVKLLIDTVTLVHSCFIEMKNQCSGLVAENMKALSDYRASEILRKLDLDNDLLEKFLPSVTKDYKPFSKNEFVNLSQSDLKEIVQNWLKWIEEFTSREISKLLNLVTSIKGIYNIREESLALQLPDNWERIWKDLSLPAINFWAEYYQPLLTERVKAIISIIWSNALESLKTNIGDVLGKVSNEKYEFPENDLRWFVWKDSPADIPQKLSKIGGLDANNSLLMKARGYSPNLAKLCRDFDDQLNLLLLDLEPYLYETEKSQSTVEDDLFAMSLSSVFEKCSDRSEIHENLQTTSASGIEHLVEFVRNEFIVDKPKSGRREVNAIVMARFLQALTALCPSLSKCFTLSKISGLVITNVKWQSICDRIKEDSISIWSVWAEYYKIKVQQHKDRYLNCETRDGYRISSIISDWERVTIEEEAEEGKRIKSEIMVPYQPSVEMQKFLAAVSGDLNKVIPHTIPKKILHDIIDYVCAVLFAHYEKLAKDSSLRQKQALQVLFDIKYITLLMVPRENKNLVGTSMEACNNILAKIDPFDSDVFYPFIHTNVKKSVQRCLLIFGNLVSHIEQLHSVLGSRSEYASNESSKSVVEPPGGLAVCTGAPWFPPLAVTAPTRNLPLMAVPVPDKSQRKKTPVKEAQKNDYGGATIKSGAAAFFGAMGSDWFSTG